MQAMTDRLMDALDAARADPGLTDSATIKEGERKLVELEDTLTRLEKLQTEVEVSELVCCL